MSGSQENQEHRDGHTNSRPVEARSSHATQRTERPRFGDVVQVFLVFLRLGLTSFGGPVAHLGYFRDEFVTRKKWITDRDYADLVALCQFLPGPASSQVGMAIGVRRAGIAGLIAAWIAFTLPSAIVLVVFAYGMDSLADTWGSGWLAGFKAAAVAVVAQAVLGMAKTLTPDAKRATIAVAGFIAVILVPHALVQIAVIVGGALLGLLWLRSREVDPVDTAPPKPTADSSDQPAAAAGNPAAEPKESAAASEDSAAAPVGQAAATTTHRAGVRLSKTTGIVSLGLLAVLLAALPTLARFSDNAYLHLADLYTRVGTLVFGGGHVVLPLLEAETVRVGLVDADTFLAGYGAAQAVPGPLFTFAAFLGSQTEGVPDPLLGATVALLAIFLPAALLVIGVLPFWDQLRKAAAARRALAGVGAAVVGILTAVLYDPVYTSGITSPEALALAVALFIALIRWRVPSWAVIIAAGILGWLIL